MKIINIEVKDWNIICEINWVAFLIALIIILGIWFLLVKMKNHIFMQSIMVDEVNLGIGDSSVKLSYNYKDKEVAFKLWVELSTRKLGLPLDSENDVIKEVYDSWYEFFKIARELLKEIPVRRLSQSHDLILLTENILNKGLRPHLTQWQAKYRKWYCEQINIMDKTPQDIQKEYPEYSALIEDLIITNRRLVHYREVMKQIAFDDN